MVVAMAGTMTARDVANALRFYTGSILYQRVPTAGAGRLDLDGNLAGTVTPQEEAAALAKQRAWAARKAAGAASTAKAIPRDSRSRQPARGYLGKRFSSLTRHCFGVSAVCQRQWHCQRHLVDCLCLGVG